MSYRLRRGRGRRSEPLLDLTKEFCGRDGRRGRQLTVTVTATNNGTAPAYNPRFLDDLTGIDFSYVGNVGGTNPPTNIDTTTYGPDSPMFSWDPGYEIPVGGQVSFTFDVQVGDVSSRCRYSRTRSRPTGPRCRGRTRPSIPPA